MPIAISTADLARFKGGQLEVQNAQERYLYRGEIKDIKVEGGNLAVEFNWLAEGKGYPPVPEKWVNDEPRSYEASLEIYTISDIGPSPDGGGNRLSLQSSIVGEIVVLYPPDGSKLDPTKVEGLVLPAA